MKLAEGTVTADLFDHFGNPSKTLGLAGLKLIWLGLRDKSDMYVGTAEFNQLPVDVQQDFEQGLKDRLSSLVSDYIGGAVTTGLLGPAGLIFDIDFGIKISDLIDKVKTLAAGQALWELDPKLLRAAIRWDDTSQVK